MPVYELGHCAQQDDWLQDLPHGCRPEPRLKAWLADDQNAWWACQEDRAESLRETMPEDISASTFVGRLLGLHLLHFWLDCG